MRTKTLKRTTKETDIDLTLDLDGSRIIDVQTGIGFFDHMLTLFAFHGKFNLNILAKGDLMVDDHHTIEDVGILLGQAVYQALGEKKGIKRYGVSYVPMDESLSRVVIDISNRPALIFKAKFNTYMIGNFSTENVMEFFKAFTQESRMNLHIENFYGENTHHQIESIFKAFGRALNDAITIVDDQISSSKGVL